MVIGKFIRKLLLPAFCFLNTVCVNSQNGNTLGQVKIASPEAASLGKFVDIPVNYHTGIPSIGIPVYTVRSGSLELPVSISYHASGLKLQEQASWVGAGWSLNAGGVITRTVRGTPDEKQSNGLQQYYGYFSDYGYLNYMFKDANGNILSTTPSGSEFVNGNYDGEPDLFFFNFNGYSGKFYFNDDRTPVLLPEQDIKIEYDYTPGLLNGLGRSIEGFIITTPDGVKYYFGKTGANPVTPYDYPVEYSSPFSLNSGAKMGRSISSWYLNKMVSPDGQFTITLSYTKDKYAYYTPSASNPISGTYTGTYNTYDLIKTLIDGVRLSKISFSSGAVDFVSGSVREDLSRWASGVDENVTDYVNESVKTLGAIQVSDNGAVCKKYSFSYTYFTDNVTALPSFMSGVTPTQTDKKRLKLESIQESGCDGLTSVPPFQFQYFSELVPRTVSFGMDHWGFINGATNADLMPSLTKNNAAYLTTTINRESAWPAMRGGTLNKIIFPTGGSTTYDFEANTFQVNNIDKVVGGLRIKTITQADGIDPQKNIVTSFNYEDFTAHSSGILYSKPVYVQKIRNDIQARTGAWAETTDGCFPTTAPIFSRNSLQPLQTTQGYHLGYNEVKVTKLNNGSSIYRYYGTNTTLADHTGVAVTNFNDAGGGTYGACSPSIPSYPAVPLAYDFIRGELKYEVHNNQAGDKILEKEYTPVYQENPVVVPGYILVEMPGNTLSPFYQGNARLAAIYEIKTAKKISNTVIERNFGIAGQSPQETTTQTLFESAYHHQPTKVITTNSLGQTIEKRIKYVNDFVLPQVSGITNCNHQNYTNVVNSFPVSYQSALNVCYTYTSSQRSVCAGDTWYNYVRDISNARATYISCRKTNYTNTSPLNTYQANHNAAKTAADAELKPICWMQDINMNAAVEMTEWKNNKLIGAVYTKYSNNRDDALGVYPEKTMKIDLASPSVSFTAAALNAGGTAIVKDSRYIDATLADFNKGTIINVTGRDGVPVAYEWGYNNTLPLVKIANAFNKTKETSVQGTATQNFNFQLGNTGSSNQGSPFTFNQTQAGTITVSIPQPPGGAQVTASFDLTGPQNQSGYLCYAGAGAASCASTPSSLSFTNMPAGSYTITFYVSTAFQSFTFNYSLSCTYPGMVIVLSGPKEFFFDGFEENGGAIAGASHTGKKYWNASYTTSFTPPNSRSYLVQWWNLVSGKWKINQQPYTNGMVLTGPADDIRIFPADAQMTTYTYDPAIGITSETDAIGRTLYYEYDALNRVSFIRDQDRNVVKKICYTYAGQTENCSSGAPLFYNVVKSGNYTRNNCGAGYIGSTVTYTVAAGTYTSAISQADADTQAQNDVNVNGQNYANTNGTCIQVFNVTGSNSKNKVYTVSFYNTGTGISYPFTLNAFASNTVLGQVPAGTYNVNFSPQGSPITANFNVNGFTQTGVSFAAFYNISVTGNATVSVY